MAKVVHSKRSGMDHTVLPANNTTPAFPVRRITKQLKLTPIIQSQRFSILGHIARMDDDADAKMILTPSTPEN